MTKLDVLKPGDEVTVVDAWGDIEIRPVTRVDGMQIIVGKFEFRRSDGVSTNSEFGHHIEMVTPEHRDRVEHESLSDIVLDISPDDLTLDQLRRIKAIMDEPE